MILLHALQRSSNVELVTVYVFLSEYTEIRMLNINTAIDILCLYPCENDNLFKYNYHNVEHVPIQCYVLNDFMSSVINV